MVLTWKAGDMAVCVSNVYEIREGANPWYPRHRGVYRVVGIDQCENGIFLEFEEDPDKFDPDAGWEATDFRKILPASKKFTEQMRTIKPKVAV